jgi:hypothetical protein
MRRWPSILVIGSIVILLAMMYCLLSIAGIWKSIHG